MSTVFFVFTKKMDIRSLTRIPSTPDEMGSKGIAFAQEEIAKERKILALALPWANFAASVVWL